MECLCLYWEIILKIPLLCFSKQFSLQPVVLSAITGYGKSQKEKDKIEREIFEQFHEGMTRRTRYDLNKRIMNDQINKDIKDNIAKGINRTSRKKYILLKFS